MNVVHLNTPSGALLSTSVYPSSATSHDISAAFIAKTKQKPSLEGYGNKNAREHKTLCFVFWSCYVPQASLEHSM